MIDTSKLKGSDGTGNAVLAHVTLARLVAATVLKVDSVSKWPAGGFIATVGTLDGTGFLIPASITEFTGHITGSDIIIDSFESGFSDLGNTIGQVVVIKQTTGWANLVQSTIAEVQGEDVIRSADLANDFIKLDGGILSAVSGLNGASAAATVYQGGYHAVLAAVASRAYTASKDTYVDVLRGGTALVPTYSLVYTEVANNAASPAVAANSVRAGIVVTNGSAIVSVQNMNYDPTGRILAKVTLAAAADILNIMNLPAKKYLRAQYTIKSVNVTNTNVTFNNDSGSNYGLQYSVSNGGTYSGGVASGTSFGNLLPQNGANTDVLTGLMDITNFSGQTKTVIGQTSISTTVAANNVPTLLWWGHYPPTTQLSSIAVNNPQTGDFGVGSELIVTGNN